MTHKTKLLQAIKAKATGNKMPIHMDFAKVDFSAREEDASYRILSATEYRIGVHLSSTVLIDDSLDGRHKEEQLRHSTKAIGRGIANEVYGELRDKLIKISVQLRHEGRYDSPTHQMVNELLAMIEYD